MDTEKVLVIAEWINGSQMWEWLDFQKQTQFSIPASSK